MADDVLRALAFAARRQGQRTMPASAWQHVLSLELGWMAPGQARALVAAAAEAGLLHEDGDGLRLAVDPASVEVPRGFRPDPEARPQAPPREDPFLTWVRRVAAARQADVEEVLDDVAKMQEDAGGLVTAQAAVLRLAAEAGIDVRRAAAEALAELRSSGAKGREG